MAYTQKEVGPWAVQPFEELSRHWMLISAEKDGAVNTMTASWGGFGVLWGKNVATVYIRPQRYTRQFVDAADAFTLTLFDGHRRELTLLGTRSGRDGDKIAAAGLHVVRFEGQPTFAEGKAVLVCRKLYRGLLHEENFCDRALLDEVYPERDLHYVYVGEVTALGENR